MCKMKTLTNPSWVSVNRLKDFALLDKWEAKWGPILTNDGPWEDWMEHGDPPRRHGRRIKKPSRKKREEEDIAAG